MTSKNVTNNTTSPLGLPNGQIINPKSSIIVRNWEKVDSSDVVKAWLAAEAITLEDAEDLPDDAAQGTESTPAQTNEGGNGGPVVLFTPKTDEELDKMTVADRAAYIEKDLGGTVKSGSSKDDLGKQIRELEAEKVKNNDAASSTGNQQN